MFIALEDCKSHGTIQSGKMKKDTLIRFMNALGVDGHSYEFVYEWDESPIGHVWEEQLEVSDILRHLDMYYSKKSEFVVVIWYQEYINRYNELEGYEKFVSIYEADLYYKRYHPSVR